MQKVTKDLLFPIILISTLVVSGSFSIVDETQRPAFMDLAGKAD